MSSLTRSFGDIGRGFARAPVWFYLGRRDYLMQYPGTILGPGWSLVAQLIFVLGVSYLFSQWSESPYIVYFAHVGLGFSIWSLMSGMINESSRCFIHSRALVSDLPLPLSFHILRLITRNYIGFTIEFLVIIGLLVLLGVQLVPQWYFALPGLLLVILSLPGYAMFVAVLGLRIPSLQPLVEVVIRFAFFLTPIIWRSNELKNGLFISQYNPFAYGLAVSRDALIYGPPSLHEWQMAGIIFILGWILGLSAFTIYYRRIPLLAARG